MKRTFLLLMIVISAFNVKGQKQNLYFILMV